MTDKPTKTSTIELSVQNISQLFETLDPYPFLERDLDKDAEAFIVGWARELPRDDKLKILIHVPKSEAPAMSAGDLSRSIQSYFLHRAEAVGRDLRELFRVGRLSLVIGLVALIGCVTAAQSVALVIGEGPIAGVLREGLVILGWVANWRPIEIFLYEWWPISRRCGLYRRLAAADVVVNPT